MTFRSLNVLILMFFVAVTVHTGEKEQKSRPLVVKKTKETIKIDGKLDEKAWKDAPVIPLNWEKVWARDKDRKRFSSLVKIKEPISFAKLLWDEKNLYFACWCTDKDLLATKQGRDEELWREDAMELFVRPDTKKPHYWEYEWSPTNMVLDIAWGEEDKRNFDKDKKWNGNGESAVVHKGTLNKHDDEDEGWTLEVRVPFSDFASVAKTAPKAGDVWQGAILHYSKWMEGKKKKIRTLISGPIMLTHEVNSYNELVFEE